MDDFSGYRIEDEHPGRALRLKWHGRPPATWALWAPYLATLLLVIVLAAVAFFLRTQLNEIMHQGLAGPSDGLLALVLTAMASALYAGTVIRGSYHGAMACGYWSELDWNAASGRFSGKFVGVPLIGNRRLDVPLAQINGLQFEVGPEDTKEMLIELRVDFREGRPEVRVPLIVQNLDVRVEALDLLFRLARIVGIGEFVVWENTPRMFTVAALQPDHIDWMDDDEDFEDEEDLEDEEELDEDKDFDEYENAAEDAAGGGHAASKSRQAGSRDSEPPRDNTERIIGQRLAIPAGEGYADYSKLAPQSGFQPSSQLVLDFDPEQFAKTSTSHRVTVWKPGERYVITRPAWSLAGCIAGPLMLGAFVSGIIISFMFGMVQIAVYPTEVTRLPVFLVMTAVSSLAALIYMWPKMRERSVEFDFGSRRMTWRHGNRVLECYLDDLRGFTLGPRRMSRSDPRRGRIVDLLPGGGAQLHVEFATHSLPIVESDAVGANTLSEIAKIQTLADSLASSFKVPCRTIDDRKAGSWITSRQWSRERVSILFALAIFLGIIFSVRGYHRVQSLSNLEEATQAIVAAGGLVEHVERHEASENYAMQDVWKVEFPQGIDDAKLQTLIEHFANIPRLDLNLARTAVTDASVVLLGPLKGLVGINLEGVAVTNAGLDQFYRLDSIEFIDLSGTAIRDEAVSMCAMNGTLRVLKLGDTRVTDMSMSNLRVRDKLLYLDVRGTLVTAAGVAELQGGVPGVSIQASPGQR